LFKEVKEALDSVTDTPAAAAETRKAFSVKG
jgi:hypothetical protein